MFACSSPALSLDTDEPERINSSVLKAFPHQKKKASSIQDLCITYLKYKHTVYIYCLKRAGKENTSRPSDHSNLEIMDNAVVNGQPYTSRAGGLILVSTQCVWSLHVLMCFQGLHLDTPVSSWVQKTPGCTWPSVGSAVCKIERNNCCTHLADAFTESDLQLRLNTDE